MARRNAWARDIARVKEQRWAVQAQVIKGVAHFEGGGAVAQDVGIEAEGVVSATVRVE